MTEPLLVLVAEPGLDLSPLTRKLWAERIAHRVVADEQGRQCLLLADAADRVRVQEWITLWKQGQMAGVSARPPAAGWWPGVLALLQAPLSAVTLLLVWLVYVWMFTDPQWQLWLTSAESAWPHQRWQLQTYLDMGWWALWRPSLLHFSLVHVLFNSLWWWILAPKIERLDGRLALLLLLLLCGLAGNAVQWWYAGPAFGGLSGVTMGLLGWVGIRLHRVRYDFPARMLPVMVGIMVLTLGADTLLPGLSGTAHGAHLGGLLTGLLLGLIWPVSSQQLTSSRGDHDA